MTGAALTLYIAILTFTPDGPTTTAHLLTYPNVTQEQCDDAAERFRRAGDVFANWPDLAGKGYWHVNYAWCE